VAAPKVKIAIEAGSKRAFAVALDWPGWARGGKGEEEALARLAEYAPRYAKAVGDRSLADATFDVVERLTGGSGTDFGVPSAFAKADDRPLKPADLRREQALLQAAWKAFDAAARRAKGKELRLGPRGGGRSLEKMTMHVLEAEEAYLHQLGRRRPDSAKAGEQARMKEVRAASLEALAARARGEQPPNPNAVRKPWSPRYFVRRSAWHALDHAWELEDRIL
jgi:hypothetical protein